jgi:toxin ParE1/3/4
MAELHFLPRFHEDLQDIWLTIAAEDIAAADRMLTAIYDRCQLLARHPDAGPRRPEIAPDCRCLVEGTYLILYRRVGRRVTLVRAIHGQRRIKPDHFSTD